MNRVRALKTLNDAGEDGVEIRPLSHMNHTGYHDYVNDEGESGVVPVHLESGDVSSLSSKLDKVGWWFGPLKRTLKHV